MKKLILSRILPIAVLAFLAACAIAYQAGVYDITFIDRPEPLQTADTPAPETEPTPESEITETEADTAPPETDYTEFETDPVSEFLGTLKSTQELTSSGFEISSDEYSENFCLSLLSVQAELPAEFSKRERTVKSYVRIPDDTYNTYTTETAETTEAVPFVEVYMDYILKDNGTGADVYKNDGTLLMSGLDTAYYTPAYTRDKNGNPLFSAEEPSKYYYKRIVTNYYYINSEGVLKESTYNDASDGRGLYINYPKDFGVTDTALYRYYGSSDELYGYGNVNGHMRTEYKYSHAFNFSDKLACAVETDGLMYFLNENLISKISGSVQIYKNYNSARRRLLREYVMPDTFGEESLGFFYFDRGLVRVRCQIVDAYHWIERQKRYTASDEDILIRADGTEFPLPPDYTLVSYSNGMILLKKNGRYGYMDYTGKWVLEPVYEYAKPFYEGLAVVGNGTKAGVIDRNGEFVIPMVFDRIGNASGGIITAFSEKNGWTIINKLEEPFS